MKTAYINLKTTPSKDIFKNLEWKDATHAELSKVFSALSTVKNARVNA